VLREMLESPDPEVRYASARALAAVLGDEAVPDILHAMLGLGEEHVAGLAQLLEETGDTRTALPALRKESRVYGYAEATRLSLEEAANTIEARGVGR
jgi:HEAT repeat protein